MMHTPYVDNHRREHDAVSAYHPSVHILPPPRTITTASALLEQHLCASGSEDRSYGYQGIYHERANKTIPIMMMTEPMMFGIVIISPKSKAAMSMVKIRVVPLNI